MTPETICASQTMQVCLKLLQKYSYQVLKFFDTGGSEAQTLLALSPDNTKVIVKISFWEGIGGNGIPWLIAQYNQLKKFQNTLSSETASYFPKVFDAKGSIEEGFFFYSLEYFSDFKPFHLKEFNYLEKTVFQKLENIITFLSENIYPIKFLENTHSNFTESIHLKRFKYRTDLLFKQSGQIFEKCIKPNALTLTSCEFENISELFSCLHTEKTLLINQKPYINLFEMNRLFYDRKKDLDLLLKVEKIPAFFHGDLLLRNILVNQNSNYKFIDLRGASIHDQTPSILSIGFEMGKVAHSFFTDLIRDNLFEILIEKKTDGFEFSLSFDKSSHGSSYRSIWNKFIPFLKTIPSLKAYTKHEKNFELSVEFAQGIHFAADAINRMSQDPSGKHTIAYFLLATMLLNDFLEKTHLKPLI